jgi:pSer/pThr/pTyr-binding forkhead associated (FHA) protein
MHTDPSTRYMRLSWSDPVTGDRRERTVLLPAVIGRAPDSAIVLNSDQISRQHARLEQAGDGVTITDLNSKNGTFANKQRVTQAMLKEGDSFQIGPFLFTLEPGGTSQELPTVQQPAPQQIAIHWTDPATGQARDILATPPVTIGRQPGSTITLPVKDVSRQHAIITVEGDQIIIADQGSANGTLLNGQKIQRAPVKPTDTIQIAQYRFTATTAALSETKAPLVIAPPPPVLLPGSQAGQLPVIENEATLTFSVDTGNLVPYTPPPAPLAEDFPPAFFRQPIVSLADIQRSGIPMTETTYLSVGGGLGSFAWVDHLLVYGVPASQIVSIGLEAKPYARYARLCEYSQIPLHERLRSNSESCPDNLWGWPSYGLREIWHSLGRGQIGNALGVGWQVFGEPVVAQTYTPRAGDVFKSIDREAARIGWGQIWRYGRAKAIRKIDDGRYVVAFTQAGERPEQRNQLILARYVHIAVGYPGIQFLADLQKYRDSTKDFQGVVNAYEEHEHIYQHLLKQGGAVLVRGRGIVASRVIQRLYEVRAQNPNVRILHLMRSPILTGHRFGRARRRVEHHWDFQPFNWPKACWGGTLRNKLEQAPDQEREQFLNDWGGTTTAARKDWRHIVKTGLREGWYQIGFGNVKRVERTQNGQLATIIHSGNPAQPETWLVADFIIDCTGLEATIDSNSFLRDMVNHYQLGRNPKGRLRVTNDFEVVGMDHGAGRVFASGAMTLGGPFAAVDSFLGLQYAALRMVDTLAALRAPGLRRLGPIRSFAQWTRWVRGVRP